MSPPHPCNQEILAHQKVWNWLVYFLEEALVVWALEKALNKSPFFPHCPWLSSGDQISDWHHFSQIHYFKILAVKSNLCCWYPYSDKSSGLKVDADRIDTALDGGGVSYKSWAANRLSWLTWLDLGGTSYKDSVDLKTRYRSCCKGAFNFTWESHNDQGQQQSLVWYF